jgi:hypothetical protein
MSHEHVESFRPLSVAENLDRHDAPEPTLTKDEADALAALSTHGQTFLRIEQERLPLDQAARALMESRDARR